MFQMKNIEEIDVNLDKTLLELFACYEESKKIRGELTNNYKDGMMNIAKARVALWPMGKITQDEYDMRMKATKMVTVGNNGGSEDYTTFLLETVVPPSQEPENESIKEREIKQTKISENSEVRQRKKGIINEGEPTNDIPTFTIPSNEDFVKQFMESKNNISHGPENSKIKTKLSNNNELHNKVEEKTLWSTKKSAEPSNPIQWFGYLPCLPLKNSQRFFTTSLELIITLANIDKKLDFLISKYTDLKVQKSNLTLNDKS